MDVVTGQPGISEASIRNEPLAPPSVPRPYPSTACYGVGTDLLLMLLASAKNPERQQSLCLNRWETRKSQQKQNIRPVRDRREKPQLYPWIEKAPLSSVH